MKIKVIAIITLICFMVSIFSFIIAYYKTKKNGEFQSTLALSIGITFVFVTMACITGLVSIA